jgi:3-dehydroquinate dehydratase/shikimate dehydrogenase
MRSGGLCASLTAESVDKLFSQDILSADYVEVRLDYLKDPQQAAHARWDRFPVPVIATCRGVDRGGRFQGSISEESKILDTAVTNGAKFVDIDYQYVRKFGSAEVIASYHNFDHTPPDLEDIIEQACASSAQIAKVAAHVNRWADNRRIFDALARKWAKPVIATGMGELGQITRIAGPSRGSFLSYAFSSGESAPGQISLKEMLDVYKFRRVKKSTKLLGVLGMPVSHSKSPVLHNRAFEKTNLDFVYMKFLGNDLDDFFENAPHCGVEGFSVTIPHKVAIIPFLNRLGLEASKIGAVNTVSRAADGWVGDNTDVFGARAALRSAGFEPVGKSVIILGRGGGAKAAEAAVEGAENVICLSRSDDLKSNVFDCDLLINATPVGMYPNVEESLAEGRIEASVVFDMVYNPPITQLLKNALSQGKTIIRGGVMLAAQAGRQFEIWTGKAAPEDVYSPDWSES